MSCPQRHIQRFCFKNTLPLCFTLLGARASGCENERLACSYWKGASSLEELLTISSEVEKAAWTLQAKSGTQGLCC